MGPRDWVATSVSAKGSPDAARTRLNIERTLRLPLIFVKSNFVDRRNNTR
jgi:hypothetical protein